jgi:hypothetical protein
MVELRITSLGGISKTWGGSVFPWMRLIRILAAIRPIFSLGMAMVDIKDFVS